MKTRLLKYTALFIFIACFNNYCLGQEYYDATNSPRQYYYNNLEGATAGSPSTYFSACTSSRSSAFMDIVTGSASLINGTKCLSTSGGSTMGYIGWNFLSNSASGTNTSLASTAWEWEFDYQNTTGAATNDVSVKMTAGSDAWRYYLLATSYTADNFIDQNNALYTTGLYLTQYNGKLILRYKYGAGSNQISDYASVDMPNNNHTYQIRVERQGPNGVYDIFVLDRTASPNTTKSALNVNIGSNPGTAYNLSFLQATSAAPNQFQFDNFNFYKVKLDYVPITTSPAGISNPIYPGMGNAIPFAVNVDVRGDVYIGRFVITYTGDVRNLFGNNGALYKKAIGQALSISGATKLGNYGLNDTKTNQLDLSNSPPNPPEYYYSGGGTDGSTVNVMNYFFYVPVLSPFSGSYPTSVSYAVSNSAADTFAQFYQSDQGPFNSTSTVTVTAAAPAGDLWDWTGAQTSWTAAGAWKKNNASTSTSIGPANTDIVHIGVTSYSGGTNQPPITSATTTVRIIEFGQFGSNSASPSPITIDLAGKALAVTDGITFDAGANVTLTGTTGSKLTLGTGTKSTVASTAVLTLASNLALTNNGTLTLQSDASGTASIAAIPTTATLDGTGSVVAQRYIPGGAAASTRKYRLLSSPVYQFTGTPNQYDFQNLKLNSLVSGANPAVNGFDVSNLNNPSIYLYKESSTSPYSAATAITQKTNAGTGFYFYFRGDRTNPSSTSNKYVKPYKDPENTTETWIGNINKGTIVVPVTYTVRYSGTNVYNTGNGFNLIGNPYPSAIDLNKITLSPECSSIIYEYNYRTGNFDTYDISTQTSSTTGAAGTALRYIASGQGFFVKLKDPTGFPAAGTTIQGTVTFTENAKTTTNNTSTNLLMGAKPQSDLLPVLRVKVEMDSTNADNTAIFFKDGYSAASDANDALRFGSIESKVSLSSTSSDKQDMIMNFMPDVSNLKRVGLSVAGSTSGLFTLTFSDAETIDKRFGIWLKDKYKKDSLDIRNNTSYTFNIDRTDTASFGSNRFEVVFHEDIPVYTLRSFTGEKNNLGAKLTWLTSNEADYTGFTLEKQDSNNQFQSLYFVQSDGSGTYSYTDFNVNTGNNYYRLKQDDADGKITYSNTINLVYELSNADKNTLVVYPNPAVSTIHTSSPSITEACRMMIFNANGTKLLDKNVDNGGNVSQYVGNYMPGTYVIQLISLKSGKIVGVTKFAKN